MGSYNYGSEDGKVYALGTQPPNQAPTADAGTDQTATVRETVPLDGSGSKDPDGDTLSYTWSIVDKPQLSKATLSDPASVNPTFVPDRMGTHTIQLVVNDDTVDSAPDEVVVTVKPTTTTVVGDIQNLQTKINALDQLQNDHIKKTDGCASTAKQPDANDWTINCDAQGQLDPELLYIVEEINALQTP